MEQAASKVIAFILKGYPRLSETFIANEMLMLERLGFKLHIIAMRDPGETKVHENVKRIRAQVSYIPDRFWREFVPLVGANIALFLKRPATYWRPFRYALFRSIRRRSSSTIKRFVQAGFLVQRCYPRSQIVHFHAHFSHGPTTVAYFASQLTGLQYSFSAHAKDIYLQDYEFLHRKIRGANFVVTCTEFNRKYLAEIGGPHAPVYRVYHGINLDYFHPQQKIPSNGVPVILSVGRFVPKKGFPVLIQALHRVRQNGLRFKAVLIGGGPLKSQLTRLVQQLELQDCVHILPQMSQSEVLAYYRRADFFALACEVQEDGDRDGIPNVLVEAMAMGIPSISTHISGIPELIDHGVNGLLVRQKDPAALAGAIESLLRQPEYAARIGTQGRQKIEREFDAEKNILRIGELLGDALASGPPAAAKPNAVASPDWRATADHFIQTPPEASALQRMTQ